MSDATFLEMDPMIQTSEKCSNKEMDKQEANKELLSNTLALNVALQTIKERCIHLQKRLIAVETENNKLNFRISNSTSDNKDNESKSNGEVSEIEILRSKNSELTLQKIQLTENITMISKENKKLWSRLSQMTKDNIIIDDVEPTTKDVSESNKIQVNPQNLVRSKTFTQNSPHPLLAKERLQVHNIESNDKDEHSSASIELEDISLINDCGFNTLAISSSETNDNGNPDVCEIDIKKCNEGLVVIKKELMKQNSDLKVALSNWRKLKTTDSCQSCKAAAAAKKPVMVDKNLETDRELFLEFDIESTEHIIDGSKNENILYDLIAEKRRADACDKICPMCGKFYTQNILFEEFQTHVESHFIEDSLEDLNLERNFEMVSHSVGNF